MAAARAQVPDLVLQRFTVKDGLPQNSVVDIAEDHRGFLWLAGFGGLSRFDGVQFEVFGRSDGLGSNRTVAVHEDFKRRLWVGTEDAGLYRWQDGRFEASGVCEQRCGIGEVRDDGAGTLFAATTAGLFVLRAGDSNWQEEMQFQGRNVSQVSAAGDRLAISIDEFVHVGTRRAGSGYQWQPPHRFDKAVTRLRFIDAVLHVFADHVYRLDEGGAEELLRADPGSSYTDVARVEGTTYFGLSGRGVEEHSAAGTRELFPLEHRTQGRDLVRRLLSSRNGSLWVGSSGGGLLRLRQRLVHSIGGPGSPLPKPVMTVSEDASGHLLAGSLCHGVMMLENDGWRSLVEPDIESANCVFSLLAEPDALWVGANGLAVLRVARDGNRREFPLLGTQEKLIVRALFRDGRGTLWAGTHRGLYVQKDDAFAAIESAPTVVIHAVGELDDGRLWLGAADGLYLEAERAGEIGALRFERYGEQAMSGVRSLIELETGDLLVGTYGDGLFWLQGNTSHRFDQDDGLFEPIASCILRDDRDRLFISGNRGISVIELEQLRALRNGQISGLTPLLLNEDDGMQVAETNGGAQPSCVRRRDGSMVFATILGIASLDPDHVQPDDSVLEIHLRVAGSRDFRDPDEVLQLPSTVSSLQIHFQAPSLRAGNEVRYRYRLADSDQEWIEANTAHSAQLSQFGYGPHRFEVEAGGGHRNRAHAQLLFVRATPWYLQRWILGCALLLVLLAAATLIRRRIRSLQQAAASLEKKVAERTEELQRALVHVEHLALTDSLTGLGNQRALMQALELREAEHGWALVLLDVDRFKLYNDAFGHPQGDQLLMRVADLLRATPTVAFAARQGGDEFAMIFDACSGSKLDDVLSGLLQDMHKAAIRHGGNARQRVVSLSIGAALMVEACSVESALRMADVAMYQAKGAGGDQFRVLRQHRD